MFLCQIDITSFLIVLLKTFLRYVVVTLCARKDKDVKFCLCKLNFNHTIPLIRPPQHTIYNPTLLNLQENTLT